jgi:hypothetical protein
MICDEQEQGDLDARVDQGANSDLPENVQDWHYIVRRR